MTLQEYYNSLTFVSLNELLKQHSQEKIERLLSTFKCSQNPDLETFLTTPIKAIQSENRAIARTYLYLELQNNTLIVVAYFTIAIKILYSEGLSKSVIKKLDGVDKDRKAMPSYLIAQLGKSNDCKYKIGLYVLDNAIEKIRESQQVIGGRFIILDSVNIQKVIEFYQSEPNSFILLDKNTKEPNVKMYYPLV